MSLCYDFQKWTIVSPASIVISLTVILSFAFADNVSAQSAKFKTYTNNDMNFTIQHPSNWQVKENMESPPEIVSFKLPDRSLPIFLIRTDKVEPYIDADTNTLKNTTLEQYVQQKLDEISSVFTNFNLIRKNDVTVGGNTGWKIEWTGEGSLHLFEIFTINNGKLYSLLYQDGWSIKSPRNVTASQ